MPTATEGGSSPFSHTHTHTHTHTYMHTHTHAHIQIDRQTEKPRGWVQSTTKYLTQSAPFLLVKLIIHSFMCRHVKASLDPYHKRRLSAIIGHRVTMRDINERSVEECGRFVHMWILGVWDVARKENWDSAWALSQFALPHVKLEEA